MVEGFEILRGAWGNALFDACQNAFGLLDGTNFWYGVFQGLA
jgi:hypothetical protein